MAQSLVLKPNAASLPPSVCRIQGCDTTVGQGRGARGLCSRHHAAAHKAGRVDELGLPATTPARKPKSVAPTASKPTPTAEPHLSRSEQQIAEQQAAKEEVAKLRAERDEANKKAAEMAAKVVRLSGSHANLEAVLGQAACKLGLDGDCVPEAILLALDAQAGLQAQLEGLEQLRASDAKLRDALAASADKLQVLYGALNLDPSRDLAGQARDITAWVAVAVEAANAFGVTSPSEMKQAIDDVVADTQPATQPAKPHRVKQAGGRDLGVLVGYLDQTGLFRVTSGPLAGAAYGCLYSAEPVERPELGEPEPGSTVWVRTSIDVGSEYGDPRPQIPRLNSKHFADREANSMEAPVTPEVLCLTIWPEWAWAIAHLGKRVENRSPRFATQIARRVGSGWLAIHAGAKAGDRLHHVANEYDAIGEVDAFDDMRRGGILWRFGGSSGVDVHDSELPRGAIVALAKIGEVLPPGAKAPWKVAESAALCLSDVFVLAEPIPCKGAQGLWTPSPIVQKWLLAALEANRG